MKIWKSFSCFPLTVCDFYCHCLCIHSCIILNQRLRRLKQNKNHLNSISKILWFTVFTVLDVAHYWRSLSSISTQPKLCFFHEIFIVTSSKGISSFWMPVTLYSLLIPSFKIFIFVPFFPSTSIWALWGLSTILYPKCFVHSREPYKYVWDNDWMNNFFNVFYSFSCPIALIVFHLFPELLEVFNSLF